MSKSKDPEAPLSPDDVLRRMLNTPPQRTKPKPEPTPQKKTGL